jgi:hypothetical protein
VLGVCQNRRETRGRREHFAVCEHALGVKGERVLCPLDGFIEALSGGDRAGEVWEGNGVIGIWVLANDGDVCLRMWLLRLFRGRCDRRMPYTVSCIQRHHWGPLAGSVASTVEQN